MNYDQNSRDNARMEMKAKDWDYKYPRGLDLRPGSRLHETILQKILEQCEYSKRVIDGMKDQWKKLDWSLNTYVPLDEAEAAVKNKDWRKPVNIVIPITFASLETFLTYLQSAFIQDPIHQYVGHGENRVGAMLLERMVAKHGQWFKEPLKLDTMWRDMLTYGIGAAHIGWAKHRVRRTVSTEVDELLFEALKGTKLQAKRGEILRYLEEEVAYEGNRLYTIDPYRIFLDPRVSPNDYQDASFIGWVEDGDIYDLLSREDDEDEGLFNVKALHNMAARNEASSKFFLDESGRNTRQQNETFGSSADPRENSPVHLIRIYMRLIPSQCGLGKEDRPETWGFTVGGDSVIIQADRMNFDHGHYPIVIGAPNTDGHSVLPVSYLATTYGMQQTIDQYFRMHFEEVRTSINNKLVVDASQVEWEDLLDSRNGGIIRVRRDNYNVTNLDAVVKQLQTSAVTGNHVRDAGVMIDLLRQANGTTDITMGNLAAMPERPTATGIDAAKTGALSRLQRIAQIIGRQCMDDIAWQCAYNSIQFQSMPMFIELAGRHEQQLRTAYGYAPGQMGEIEIGPYDLQPYFDVVPRDGALPNNENAQAWTTIMQTLLGVEGLGAQIAARSDVFKIFTHWARIMGARDIHEFVNDGGNQQVQPQVVPEQMMGALEQQVQAGNMVPMQEMVAA